MSDVVIRAEELAKRYRIGGRVAYNTLRDRLAELGRVPARALLGRAGPRAEQVWALQDVSFELRRGEVLGVIGRNGAGKSTLLKILARITRPSAGRIGVRGRVGALLEVGTGFHPELSGRENIYLNGAILGMRRAEIARKFDPIVAFAEVERFVDTPVKHYSSGMYTRLAFAVAAHLEPEILVVDEVLAVGDAQFQQKCLGKMGALAREGRTVLFVSHNTAAVQALCGRAILLEGGRLVASGPVEAVLRRYLHGLAELSQVELGARADRAGDGRLRFTGLRLLDGQGGPAQALVSGQDGALAIEYTTAGPIRQVRVSAGFYTLHGQFLLMCDTTLTGESFERLEGRGSIVCRIPALPFAPGSYRLNLYCEGGGALADWVQDAALITVAGGDFYGTGRLPPESHGGLLARHSWALDAEG